jgi:hypothetical protein
MTSPPTAPRSGTGQTPRWCGTSAPLKANLEGVYGAGPVGAPYLYSRADPVKLRLAPSGHDVRSAVEEVARVRRVSR